MLDTVFFWQDGVVTTSLAEVTIGQLEAVLGSTLDTQRRRAIRDQSLELQLGRTDGSAFCRSALDLSQAPLDEEELALRIQENVTLIPGVLEVIEELLGRYNLWLIAHCPRGWLQPIGERLGLLDLFPGESILICPELRLTTLIPDVFHLTAERAKKPLEDCLLVAADSAITTAAVNNGLNAIVFADAYRLRRELGLRKLLTPSESR